MRKMKVAVAGISMGCLLALSVGASAQALQEVTTWSHVMTGISAEFEAGHKGTGAWGTDPSRVITQSWVALQDGSNGPVETTYSPKVSVSAAGRYRASDEHFNNPFVTTYKYYGWYY